MDRQGQGMNTNTKTPLPLLKRLEEINKSIPWMVTPSCNQAKRKLEKLIAEQSRTKDETAKDRVIIDLQDTLQTHQEESIPKSKVKARIKELEDSFDMKIRNREKEIYYGIKELKTLLDEGEE